MTFQEALNRCFRFLGDARRDNLPSLARARFRVGREGDRGRATLAKMMRYLEYRRGAEIGTHRGDSAVMWCRANPGLHLTCIDPYLAYSSRPVQNGQDDCYATAQAKLKPYDVDICRAASLDVVDDFADGSLDFVYIDGDHSFDPVMQDLIRWAPKVRRGGLIILHDYTAMWRGGIVEAVNAYTHCHRVEAWYVTQDSPPTAFWEKGSERA